MKTTQKAWCEAQLRVKGYVTRNDALKCQITRLGAIVNLLNNGGWEITGDNFKTEHGLDYKYTLIFAPYLPPKPTYWVTERDGTRRQVV